MAIKIASNVDLKKNKLGASVPGFTIRDSQALALRMGKLALRKVRDKSESYALAAFDDLSEHKPRCIIIHTTGRGPADRLTDYGRAIWRSNHPELTDTFQVAEWLYTKAMMDVAHVLVGQNGERVRLVPDEYCGRHVGVAKSQAYASRTWANAGPMRWWKERWPMHVSPRALAGGNLWTVGSANQISLGLEVACPLQNPTGPWSDAAWHALCKTVAEWAEAHSIPIAQDYVFTHSDAHPVARTAKGKPYDPGPLQWSWQEFERRFDAFLRAG
jgi:hypothetical protein